MLETVGVDVEILDMACLGIDEQGLRARLGSSPPGLVGVSCLMANMEERAASICRVVKDVAPDCLVGVGGNHATFHAQRLLRSEPAIDVVGLYEGEETILQLAAVARGAREISSVPGVACRKDGRIVWTSQGTQARDLDCYPVPARHLLPMEMYDERFRGVVLTSRGCPFRCAYCSTAAFNGRRVRVHSVSRVLEEIRKLTACYGVRHVNFVDDTFTFDRQRVVELCGRMSAEFPGMWWSCETRVDLIDDDLLARMHHAGCRTIFYGIESVFQPALDRVEKGFSVVAARRAVRATREHGIDAQVSFIIGLPEDDEALTDRTLSFLAETAPASVMVGMLAVYAGTPMYEDPTRFGIREFSNTWTASQQLTPMTSTAWLDREAQKRCYVRLASALATDVSKGGPL